MKRTLSFTAAAAAAISVCVAFGYAVAAVTGEPPLGGLCGIALAVAVLLHSMD